jgi:hypothetical protein
MTCLSSGQCLGVDRFACLKAIVLAVLLLCRPVMMPWGSGMIAPS